MALDYREDLHAIQTQKHRGAPTSAWWPASQMRVEVEQDIEISAKTVDELRSVTIWPENLAILTPQERYPESAVRVGKANVVARTSPKS